MKGKAVDVQWYPVSSLNLFFQSNKHTDKNSDRGWVVFKATDNRLGLKLNTNKDGSDTEFETFSYGKISTWITLTDLLQFNIMYITIIYFMGILNPQVNSNPMYGNLLHSHMTASTISGHSTSTIASDTLMKVARQRNNRLVKIA